MDLNVEIAELEKGTNIIQAIYADISEEEARRKPDSDTWSMLEVICHLHDEEHEDFREHIDQALHRPEDIWHPVDPEGWVTTREYNAQDYDSRLADFMQEREQSITWLRGLVAPDWNKTSEAPFGRISAGNLLASWVMHDNLHIRQLIGLRHELIKKKSDPYSTRYAGEW